jgi:hypothetical protein
VLRRAGAAGFESRVTPTTPAKVEQQIENGTPGQATVPATPKAGKNTIVAKVGNTGGGW